MKYNIPKDIIQPQWVIDHFKYINTMDKLLTIEQKICSSELSQICQKYKDYTDKCPTSSYYIKHNYTEIYNNILKYYKNKKNNILEIGIKLGGSLKMWKEYFKYSNIYGIDIDTSQIKINLDNCTILNGNAYDEDIITKLFINTKFDIIIDDGSHVLDDQIKCLNIYSNLLNDDGILIIEDISSINNAKEIIKNFKGNINKCSIIDRTHCVPSLDDINIIYYK
jgi:23S rRNA U2552 (ribose-2'-O)-methylase RlmE/FtsJ